MITVETNYREQAFEKINSQTKDVTGQKGRVMCDTIAHALISFCNQDNEFAKSVVDGGSFPECMKKVADGVGNSISDISAIEKAVNFYFKGAVVKFSMTILVNPYQEEKKEQPVKKSVLDLSLDDLF